jgi:hypothetical protein
LRGGIEKSNLNQAFTCLRDQERVSWIHLPWKEEDLEDLVERKREGRELPRERKEEVLPTNLEGERIRSYENILTRIL